MQLSTTPTSVFSTGVALWNPFFQSGLSLIPYAATFTIPELIDSSAIPIRDDKVLHKVIIPSPGPVGINNKKAEVNETRVNEMRVILRRK